MDILLVSDFGIHHNLGGAQRSNQILIQEGFNRGHNIKCHHYDTPGIPKGDYDIVISSNLEVLNNQEPGMIDWLNGLPNHVRLEHDMCHYLDNSRRQTLYENCKKTFFLTPHHYNCYKKYYGDYFVNVEIVPDPIDTSVFYDYKKATINRVVYIGFLHELKGLEKLYTFAKSTPMEVDIYGWGDKGWISKFEELPNCMIHGPVAHEKIAEILNRYSYMFLEPVLDEPFCRAVGEALCCGVEIISSSNNIGSLELYKEVGHDKYMEMVGQAGTKFWEILEQL